MVFIQKKDTLHIMDMRKYLRISKEIQRSGLNQLVVTKKMYYYIVKNHMKYKQLSDMRKTLIKLFQG